MNKNPLKGEIWLVNFEPAREGELGKQKRPSIIFQANDASEIIDTITLIPLSSDTEQYNEIHTFLKPSKVNGLTKPSAAICSHIYTVSKKRLVKKIGTLNQQEMETVTRAITLHLDIEILWNLLSQDKVGTRIREYKGHIYIPDLATVAWFDLILQ